MRDGAAIRLRRYGDPLGIRLVLSHGNGLAINAYAPFWLPLTARFDVIVFDIRNHGENPRHELDQHTWTAIFDDFEEIFQGIQRWCGKAPTVGVFHSLSAMAALHHALAHDARWKGLVLFEPPLVPPQTHPLSSSDLQSTIEHETRARRRQEHFSKPEELAAQLRRRSAFAAWHPDVAMLMAQHTLRQTDAGCWELRNPKELEARIYRSKPDSDLWQRIKRIPIPTILIGGDPQSPHASPSAWACEAVHADTDIEYAFVPETSHFLQLEKPEACRSRMLSFLREYELLPCNR